MSPVKHAMSAPPLNPPTPRMLDLNRQAEPLEAELDSLRANDGIFKPANDRVRELRQQLSRIDAEFTAEFRRTNPEWVRHWSTATN